MRVAMKHDGSGNSYIDFLAGVRRILLDLAEQCSKQGLVLEDLPRLLGRSRSSVAQLIDEYYWITVTREVRPPDTAVLARWLRWSFGNQS